MQNITQYSDSELSLNFMNDEGLYNSLRHAARYNNWDMVTTLVDDLFIYTPDQLQDLKNTFEEEVKEFEEG